MKSFFEELRGHMMTGVSYMIPFVVSGGIMLALAVLISGEASVPTDGFAGDLADIGLVGLGLMVPVLSGFISYSIADRPGLAPGFIGGVIANNIGAGFIGGIVSGFLAGYIVYFIKKIKLPNSLRSIAPILIIPLASVFIVGILMYRVIGTPIASFMTWLTTWLESLGTGNLAILGLVLGTMIASDMGGPINKVAFGFGSAMVGTLDPVTGLPSQTALTIMAGIGVAIATPAIGCGLATLLAPKKFTIEERESGKAAIIMGLMGLTEGAIPFAAADPFRVIPANIIGGAVGASIAMLMGAGNPAPWGGLIVAAVVTKPLGYIAGVLVGSIITAGIIALLKKELSDNEQTLDDDYSLEDDFDFDIEIG